MNNKTDGVISILAAILVLFSAMLDPEVSVILAIVLLAGLGVYHLLRK